MASAYRIIIQPDGPYFVRGNVPLTVLPAANLSAEERTQLRADPDHTRVRPVHALCRCGISKMMPLCDGVHLRIEWDGVETADRQPPTERASTTIGPRQDELVDDAPLCSRAGFCEVSGESVWDLVTKSDEPGVTDRLASMVGNCPSGRLRYDLVPDGDSETTEEAPHIMMVPGGPFWVVGEIPLVTWEGEEYAPRARRALCRCGASRNKPFCDGAHQVTEFER
jgi:CDGSH-type Zn-finger protein